MRKKTEVSAPRRGGTMQQNINVRLGEDLLQLVEEAAELEERSMSNWVRVVLRREAQKVVDANK
jgi:uncharacterized protein (DUF1778 family)